jgi:hypothetical protein
MRVLLIAAMLAVAAPIRHDRSPPPQEQPLAEKIVGDWRIDNGPNDGVLRVIRFTATQMLIVVDGKPWPEDLYSGQYKIDAVKNPVHIDMRNYIGYLKVEGDELTLYISSGKVRPATLDQNGVDVTKCSRVR